ncbi:Alpha/Beta hydrolase protein [Amylostereum chailletii]|nr:Alpha/Beta hydrolase protein [Amylostereum chailletii]
MDFIKPGPEFLKTILFAFQVISSLVVRVPWNALSNLTANVVANHPTHPGTPPHRLRTQPLKALYIFHELVWWPLRFSWWVLSNISPDRRARPSWSFEKAVAVRILRRLEIITGRIGALYFLADHRTVSRGKDISISWVDPAPASFVNALLATWSTAAHVAQARIPGYWLSKSESSIPTASPARQGEKIIYHLHGGAYILFSASPRDFVAGVGEGLLEHAPSSVQRAFTLEYRLSKAAPQEPANAFPAALLDALAGYAFLVTTLGFASSDIVLAGDSAGANLALALTRYLAEHPSLGLRPPGALLLLSPWADLSDSHADGANADVDYIGGRRGGTMTYARAAFLGPQNALGGGELMRGRYVSPGSVDPRSEAKDASYASWPRTMVVSGGAEALSGSIEVLVGRMRRDMGEDRVRWYIAQDAVHDFLALWPLRVWEPERSDTLREVGAWMETQI